MTPNDIFYIQKLIAACCIRSPVLELGAGYGGATAREVVERAGLEYKATDICGGPGVDYRANFEADDCLSNFPRTDFGSVFVLNVLEHAFLPIAVLDNAIKLCKTGGTVVTIAPCMWPVHNYPRDYQRLLPDWFVTYAERRPNVRLIERHFEFLGFGPVADFMQNGERRLPSPFRHTAESLYSRAVHKLFNTTGRGQWTAHHVAIGAVFEKA